MSDYSTKSWKRELAKAKKEIVEGTTNTINCLKCEGKYSPQHNGNPLKCPHCESEN